AWQEVNKQLNANMKLQLVPSTDYPTRIATIMAGGDVPDILQIQNRLTLSNVPQFLKASYADLTPFLGGDAVKDYPNLAAFPTSAWGQTAFDGAIYAVPLVRPYLNYTWFVNQTLLDSAGASQPKNGDDFKKLLKDLTRPQANVYGMGALAPSYGLIQA